MKQTLLFLLTLLCSIGVQARANTPANDAIYHTVTVDVSPGIDLRGLPAGELIVQDGDHLHLVFAPEYAGLEAKDVIFQIDGVDTKFKDFGSNYYYSYILNPIKKDHTVRISLHEFTVTLPEVQGARMMPQAGDHSVVFGEPFRFSILPEEPWTADDVRVYANGVELPIDLESPSIKIYPAPLNYMIPHVTEAIKITVEKLIVKDSTTVTLPELEGARTSPAAGTYSVAVGDPFRFSILPDLPQMEDEVEVYANEQRLQIDPNAPSLLIYPAPLNYLIEKVTEPIVITVKNLLVSGGIEDVDPLTKAAPYGITAESTLRLSSTDGQLFVETNTPQTIRVYSVDGTLRASSQIEKQIIIALTPGIYIVKGTDKSYKVVVN